MAQGDLVRFGLTNVYYATPASAGSGFDTPVRIKGAVRLTTTPEGDSYDFYADNRIYFHTETNNGYTGTLEVAAVNDAFLTAVLGYQTDETSGLTYEVSNAQPKQVALLFEIDGNEEQQRVAMYGVTFSRVETEANTTSESTEPDTVTLNFTCIGQEFTIGGTPTNVTKAHCSSKDADVYTGFFTKVPIPGVAA